MHRRPYKQLASWWPGEIKWNVDMAAYSTLRAGGVADALIEVQDVAELRSLVRKLVELQIRYLVLGRGSNILVSGQGYSGVILRLRGVLNTITCRDENDGGGPVVRVRAGAGCSMAALVSWCRGRGLTGLEFMVGIPGSVGGAVRMNAGAWGHAVGERLLEIECVTPEGREVVVPVTELLLSYRNCACKNGEISRMVIHSATFTMTAGTEEQVRARCGRYLKRRQGRQPTGVASAGSFFKNPQGDYAGRLIEAAGLKGICCGQAMVSPDHANFIVNTGRATAEDIVELMQLVQDRVLRQFGVRLEPEVEIIQGASGERI